MKPEEFEAAYLALYHECQALHWENEAERAQHDLNGAHGSIHELFLENQDRIRFSGRKRDIFQRLLRRTLVDCDPTVARLTNYLESQDNFPSGGSRLERALRMRPHVVELMRIRNEKAHALGYGSYGELVFYSEELNLPETERVVRSHLDGHLEEARALITRHNMRLSTWFEDIDRIGTQELTFDPRLLLEKVLEGLGLREVAPSISVHVIGQPIFGIARVVQPGKDIRILLKPRSGLAGVGTLFHEAGHAIAHACDKSEGLFRAWTSCQDELFAIIVEKACIELFLEPEARASLCEIGLLENVRCGVSFLFEVELNRDPHLAEDLFIKHYQQLGEVEDPRIWAVDSFRSLDPWYIHNYVLGDIVGSAVVGTLSQRYGDDSRAWGRWMDRELFRTGRSVSMKEKLAGLVPDGSLGVFCCEP